MEKKSNPSVIFSTRVGAQKAIDYDRTCLAYGIERSSFIRDALESHHLFLVDSLSKKARFENSVWGREISENQQNAQAISALFGIAIFCGIAIYNHTVRE
jgi:hypothetical protein